MAVRTIKARVELDGEKEYKAALADLNSGNRVLASEMRKLQAQYKGNTDSVDFLREKGELLDRQLAQQKEKVETLRQAVANSAKANGESSKTTQDWIVKLNNAEAAQYDLEHAVEENNNAIAEQGQQLDEEQAKMTGLGDAVDGLTSKLGINLPEGAKNALNGVAQFSETSVKAFAATGAAVAALIKVVKQLHENTLEAAADVDGLITESMVTGLSTRTLQELQYAENLIDVNVSTITGSLTKLTKNIADAANGNDTLAESFTRLGVSIMDTSTGQLRSAEDVFFDLIDALGGVQNQTERDAAAMELLGKSAQDLNPLILQGSDALRALAEEAEATGYVLDESQIQKLGEVDDAYQRMQLQIEATKKELAVEFAPASVAAMELFSRAVRGAGEFLDESNLVRDLASILSSTASLGQTMMDFTGAIPSWMSPLSQFTKAFDGLAVVLATVADAANLLSGIMPWNWGSGKATTALGWNIGSGQMSNLQRYYRSQPGYVSYNAAGTDNWRGGLTWVGETGPELVELPRGSQIHSSQESRQLAGGDTYIFNIDAKNVQEYNDLVRIAQEARVTRRMR